MQEETDRLPKRAWSRGWGETQGQEGELQRVDKGGQEPLSLGGRGREASSTPSRGTGHSPWAQGPSSACLVDAAALTQPVSYMETGCVCLHTQIPSPQGLWNREPMPRAWVPRIPAAERPLGAGATGMGPLAVPPLPSPTEASFPGPFPHREAFSFQSGSCHWGSPDGRSQVLPRAMERAQCFLLGCSVGSTTPLWTPPQVPPQPPISYKTGRAGCQIRYSVGAHAHFLREPTQACPSWW